MTDYITYPTEQETQTVEPTPTDNTITEQNMREYFERLVSHVVSLSTQAQKVNELTQKLNDMSYRVDNLEIENSHLKADLQAQIETVNQVRAQHDAVELELHNSREHTHALAETIVMRDKRVAELDQSRQSAEDNANEWHQELKVAENRISDQEALINDLRSQLEDATKDRDGWHQACLKAEKREEELRTNFDRINSILNPPRPVENYVSEVQPVADVA
jgi:chromosome segregation ATPase